MDFSREIFKSFLLKSFAALQYPVLTVSQRVLTPISGFPSINYDVKVVMSMQRIPIELFL